MTDNAEDFAFEAPPQPPIGTHPAVVTNVYPTDIETAEGTKKLVRWEVTLTLADGTDVPVDALSSMNFGPRAKARKWATALGHSGERVAPEELIGKPCLAVIGESDDGYAKLLDLVAPPATPKAKSK